MTQTISELFHHVRRELRVLLNEKLELALIDWRKSAGGLRQSVDRTGTVIEQRDHADQRACPCGLDHIIANPDVHFPFQYHVHPVRLVAFPEKEIARSELQRVSILIKKPCKIHECNVISDRNYKRGTITAKLRLCDNPHSFYSSALQDPDAISNAIGYAKFRSRSHDAAKRLYDATGEVIKTHTLRDDFKDP